MRSASYCKRPIDGEHEVVALHRRHHLVIADRDRAAFRIAFEHQLARLAGELIAVRLLEARRPGVVDVDAAEDRARHVARRVVALRLLDQRDTLESERRDLLGLLVGDLAGEIGESPFAAHLLLDVPRIEAEDRRDRGGLDVWVLDHGGIDEDGLCRLRHGQLDAVAVVDRSAIGGDLL